MASANKPTAVHFSLIFFVMLSIILAVVAFMFRRDYTETVAQLQNAEATAASEKAAAAKFYDAVQSLVKTIGHGNPNSPDATVTLAAAEEQLKQLGGPLADQSYNATMVKMKQELDTLTTTRDQLKNDLEKTQQEYLALQTQYNARVDQHQTARSQAEGNLQSLTTAREEALAAKDKEITDLRTQYNQVQLELERTQEKYEQTLKERDDRIARLVAINDRLRADLDNVRQISFEVEDGTLVRVDHSTGLVWINLGEADRLSRRTTFSVYDKYSHGVGRSESDIKGKIEVTRVVGPHLAEARVLSEEITRPMTPGDLIYTPLWSPGRTETFAFAGIMDLDNDGRDDRELLYRILETVGAEVSTELMPNGERTGKPIDVNTKFLVIGGSPELTSAVQVDEEAQKEKALVEEFSTQMKELQTEAREHGVRVVNLNDFLAYIGYQSKRRLYLPGQSRPYDLKAGTTGTATDESIGGSSTPGTISGAYGRSPNSPANGSSGQSSGLFRSSTER